MKRPLQYILSLLLFISLSYSQNLQVSGITSPSEANGYYLDQGGTQNGKTLYTHTSGNYFIYWDSGNVSWNIDNDFDGSVVYYYETNDINNPENGFWQAQAGTGSVVVSNTALPVELTSFSASSSENGIIISWGTATEVNNYGFEIERMYKNSWNKIAFIEGHGNSNSPKEYSFIDKSVTNDKYSYRLKQIDFDGQFEYSNEIEVNISSKPGKYSITQNYPNPFNPVTSIKYTIPDNEFVSIKVFDILGNEVATLVNENKNAGNYNVEFKADNFSSGLYFYKIQAGSYTQIRKMLLLK